MSKIHIEKLFGKCSKDETSTNFSPLDAPSSQAAPVDDTIPILPVPPPATHVSKDKIGLFELSTNEGETDLEVEITKTRKRVLGLEHVDTLTSTANLASTYRHQDRWKEAEELEVHVMQTRKRLLGLEHPDTLSSMDNLASTYTQLGRWKEVEELEG